LSSNSSRRTPQITEESDSESSTNSKPSNPAPVKAASAPPPVKKPVVPGKGKWEGEDEEDSEPVVSNWRELCIFYISRNHRAIGKNLQRKNLRRTNLRLLPLQEKKVPLKPSSQKKRRRKQQRKMRTVRTMTRMLSLTLENKLGETKNVSSKLILIMPPNSLERPLLVVSFDILLPFPT